MQYSVQKQILSGLFCWLWEGGSICSQHTYLGMHFKKDAFVLDSDVCFSSDFTPTPHNFIIIFYTAWTI